VRFGETREGGVEGSAGERGVEAGCESSVTGVEEKTVGTGEDGVGEEVTAETEVGCGGSVAGRGVATGSEGVGLEEVAVEAETEVGCGGSVTRGGVITERVDDGGFGALAVGTEELSGGGAEKVAVGGTEGGSGDSVAGRGVATGSERVGLEVVAVEAETEVGCGGSVTGGGVITERVDDGGFGEVVMRTDVEGEVRTEGTNEVGKAVVGGTEGGVREMLAGGRED